MSDEDLAALDLNQFFQENPDWDDGWATLQQEEEAVEEEEDQAGGRRLSLPIMSK